MSNIENTTTTDEIGEKTYRASERVALAACADAKTFREYANGLGALWALRGLAMNARGRHFRMFHAPIRTRRGWIIDEPTLLALLGNATRPGGYSLETIKAWQAAKRTGAVRRARGGSWVARGGSRGIVGDAFAEILNDPRAPGFVARTLGTVDDDEAGDDETDGVTVYVRASAGAAGTVRVFTGFVVADRDDERAFLPFTHAVFNVAGDKDEALDEAASFGLACVVGRDTNGPEGYSTPAADAALARVLERLDGGETWFQGSGRASSGNGFMDCADSRCVDVFRVSTSSGDTFDVACDDVRTGLGLDAVGMTGERDETPAFQEFAEECVKYVPDGMGRIDPADVVSVERVRVVQARFTAPGYLDRTDNVTADVAAPHDHAAERAAFAEALEGLEADHVNSECDRGMFDSLNDEREARGIPRKRWDAV